MFKNSIVVMILNTISRLLGLVREMLIAALFGSSGYTDAYFASNRIANLFTTLLGEGSLGSVFIPLYLEKNEKEGEIEAKKFVNTIVSLMFNFSLTIAVIMFIFSKSILKYIIGFNDPTTFDLANKMLKIMSFYIVFIALTGVMSSYINTFKKFFISTSVSIIFNLTIIIGTILTHNSLGIIGLATSFMLSGILQFLYLLPTFLKYNGKFKYTIIFNDYYVKSFFKLMIPALVGIFAYQINELINTKFAASLSVGTISAINYASRLYLLPVGVFGVSLSVVIFPTLSSAVIKGDIDKEKHIFLKGLKLLTFLVIPSFIVLYKYSYDIIKLIYARGKFNANSIAISSEILSIYSLGIFFFTINHLLTRVHYSHKNRKTPVIASIISIICNITIAFLVYKKYEHIGLTSATVISALINFIILFISINNKYIKIPLFNFILFILKTFIISVICYYLSTYFDHIIIKLIIFAIVYFVLWVYDIITKKSKIFD